MELRQVLAVGAAAALLSSGLAASIASPAQAAEVATLQLNTPKSVGINASPVEFDAQIGNQGGDIHTDARMFLTFELGDRFGSGGLPPAAVEAEYKDGNQWKQIVLRRQGKELTGSPDRKFLSEARNETLRLRVSVDDLRGTDARSRTDALAQARTIAKRAVAERPAAPEKNPCKATEPGFRLVAALNDVNRNGQPVGKPIAKDGKNVALGGAAVDFNNLEAEYVAGAKPKRFALIVCNSSDSAYENVAPYLLIARGENAPGPQLKASEVVLELNDREGGAGWTKVDLTDAPDGSGVIAFGLDVKHGVPLPAGERVPFRLRMGFAKDTRPSAGILAAVATLPLTNQFGTSVTADFQIVAAPAPPTSPPTTPPPTPGPTPPSPAPRPTPPPLPTTPAPPGPQEPGAGGDLPHTGANLGAGVLGGGLLLAGAVLLLLVRLRRNRG